MAKPCHRVDTLPRRASIGTKFVWEGIEGLEKLRNLFVIILVVPPCAFVPAGSFACRLHRTRAVFERESTGVASLAHKHSRQTHHPVEGTLVLLGGWW